MHKLSIWPECSIPVFAHANRDVTPVSILVDGKRIDAVSYTKNIPVTIVRTVLRESGILYEYTLPLSVLKDALPLDTQTDDWLESHGVEIIYSRKTTLIRAKGKQFTITGKPKPLVLNGELVLLCG